MSLKKLVISVKVVFEVIRPLIGGILSHFKPRQIKYQNEALGPVIKEKGCRGHLRSSDPKIEGIWGHLG